MKAKRERCGNKPCRWCDRDDWACRFCHGSGWWRPEKPHRDGSGEMTWVRVDEPCRMCGNTGKEHDPLSEPLPSSPSPTS